MYAPWIIFSSPFWDPLIWRSFTFCGWWGLKFLQHLVVNSPLISNMRIPLYKCWSKQPLIQINIILIYTTMYSTFEKKKNTTHTHEYNAFSSFGLLGLVASSLSRILWRLPPRGSGFFFMFLLKEDPEFRPHQMEAPPSIKPAFNNLIFFFI